MKDLNRIDEQIVRYTINKYISMPKLFDSLGIPYNEYSTMYCPFHHNVNSKAAKLYHDDTGWQLWCFSEQEMYGAYDIYKYLYDKPIDLKQLAIKILQRLPADVREQVIEASGEEFELDISPYDESLQQFKEHSINYETLVSNILLQIKKGEIK